jgi:predicted O-linked N-acetylglucosamine transferase (SPINDLY family)
MNIEQTLEEAFSLYHAGKRAEAESHCQQILTCAPDHPGSLHLTGIFALESGRYERARELIGKAIAGNGQVADFHCNMGIALRGLSRLEQAIASFSRAIELDGGHCEALNNLGYALRDQGKLEEAAARLRQALALRPNYADAHINLGNVNEAQGRIEQAATHYRKALALRPDSPVVHYNLGSVLVKQRKLDEAEAELNRAVALRPEYVVAHYNLGNLLRERGNLSEAEASYRRVIAIDPAHIDAISNLSSALMALGRIDEAMASFRRVTQLAPDHATYHSNVIFGLNFDPGATQADLAAERARWNERHAKRFATTIRPHDNNRYPHRRLRIGYVSSHFRSQAASYAFGGVILHHDRAQFEVFCYSDTNEADHITDLLRARADTWRNTADLTDESLAELIRADRIDILVDLVGHMGGQRLLVFARKPAPIQVTAWGEPTGTGLETMDYLLADPVLVPSAMRHFLTEQVVDLPNFLGYWMPEATPEPGPLPALSRGEVTFGSFNRFNKVQRPVLESWARILRAVPGSRLMLKGDKTMKDGKIFVDASQQARLNAVLAENGVALERIALAPWRERDAHFAAYNEIDIALDPFPHGGGMTTLDALWMGVPVVTFAGCIVSSRLAAASLSAIGLTDFIAPDLEGYVALAGAKARDLEALAALRASLRPRLKASAFGDPARYTAAVEAAYRAMWQRWATAGASGCDPGHVIFEPSIAWIVRLHPENNMQQSSNAPDLISKAITLHQRGDVANAEQLYVQILAGNPHHFDALHMLGVIRIHQGRNTEAVELIGSALQKIDNDARAWSNYGVALNNLKAYEQALTCYEKAIALSRDFPEALNNHGNTLTQLGRTAEAIKSFERAIKAKPDYAEAYFNRGNAYLALNDYRHAISDFDKALAITPARAEIWSNRGNALGELNRWDEALKSYDKALALRPDYADALNNRGHLLFKLHRLDEALANYNKALFFAPDHVEVLNNRGNALKDLRRSEEAIADFEKALSLAPDHRLAFGGLADAALKICDWPRMARIAAELPRRIFEQKSQVPPLALIGYSGDPALQLECAKINVEHTAPVRAERTWKPRERRDKIRIGYLSGDFHRHATAFLMAELFELHDRSRFEVLAFSYGPPDASDMRTRLLAAFDSFHDVLGKSDAEAASLVSELRVDIAVDLKGWTRDCRPGILGFRPAPIQVNYLGYPGTVGATFIDYVIADPIVLPFDQQPFWSEKIVHLPDCYQVNDSKRAIAERTPSRQEAGLPEDAFVFCSFNNTWKVTAEVFDVWMRLLGAVPGSVLWVLRDNVIVENNLRREAQARGIDAGRLVFAETLPLADHLARHRLADLFVDTLPVNAHTTASDALWTGLPLVTCCGQAFASRVAASLLHAVGLSELVTHDLAQYEQMALRLAREPALLAGLRERLRVNRATCTLFDIQRSRKHIEAAYTTMWKLFLDKQSPRSFTVEAQP